jgi:hypothetical protein
MNQFSKSARRGWIILNYVSLLLFVLSFYLSKSLKVPLVFFTGGGASLFLIIIAYLQVFYKTKLWKMSHSGLEGMDERQAQVYLNAMRIAYSVFTVVAIVIIYLFSIIEHASRAVVVGAAMLYLAHSLPAAVVGWTEKEI